MDSRLNGTILRYNGEPVYCRSEGETLELTDIVTGNHRFSIEPDDFLLDISSVPLGYMNSEHYRSAVYLKRQPFRRYKQGVVLDLLQATSLNHGGVSTSNLRCRGFVNSIKGIFPTVKEAILNTDARSMALSRDVAITQAGANCFEVYIKEVLVGVLMQDGLVHLPTINEVGIPNWISINVLGDLGLKTIADSSIVITAKEEITSKKKKSVPTRADTPAYSPDTSVGGSGTAWGSTVTNDTITIRR